MNQTTVTSGEQPSTPNFYPVHIHLKSVPTIPMLETLNAMEMNELYEKICTVETEHSLSLKPKPTKLPLEDVSMKREHEILISKLYTNHEEHLMLKICDCIAGAILGYIRDHANESKAQQSLYNVIQEMTLCLLEYKKMKKSYLIKIRDGEKEGEEEEEKEQSLPNVLIYDEVEDKKGRMVINFETAKVFEYSDDMKPLIKRFLFNANPIAYHRYDQTYISKDEMQEMSMLFKQFKSFKSEYEDFKQLNRKHSRDEDE